MAKSIKFENDIYLDSSSITHERTKLKDILDCKYNTFTQSKQTDLTIGNSYLVLPFDTNDNPNDKLIIQSNGTIKIGKGIKRIMVSGACSLSTVNDYDLRRLSIFKNNEIVNRTQLYHNSYQSFSLVPKCVNVKENDIISLKFTGGKANSCTIPVAQGEVTYMNIKIVE